MATFVVLAGFTDQGIRNVKETAGGGLQGDGEEERRYGQRPLLDSRSIRRHCGLRGAGRRGRDLAFFECLLAWQCPLPNAAGLLVRRNEDDHQQDGLKLCWQTR